MASGRMGCWSCSVWFNLHTDTTYCPLKLGSEGRYRAHRGWEVQAAFLPVGSGPSPPRVITVAVTPCF